MAKNSFADLAQITEPRCLICNSKHRSKIEKLVVAGFSYHSIAEELMLVDENFRDKRIETVRKNVARHAQKHINIHDKAYRQIIEKRAKEQGILTDEVEGSITTSRSLLDLVVSRGHEQLTDPEYRVRMADVIEATKMLEDAQRQEYVAQVDVMQRQIHSISQAIKELVPEDILPSLISRAQEWFENPDQEPLTRGRGLPRGEE